MKVSISSPIASLDVELTEDQLFSLFDFALNYVGKKSEIRIPVLPPFQTGGIIKKPQEAVIPLGDKTEEVVKVLEDVVSRKTSEPVHLNGVPLPLSNKPTYKGFLYLQCEECGKFKGFMPKNPISEYHCDCGHTTKLKDMKAMYVNCECGQKFKYLTNATGDTVTIDCYNCGSPVDLEYHGVKNNYQTMGYKK